MSKNLTVGMPLAVPHQKPPPKFASRLYPFLVQSASSSRIEPQGVIIQQVIFEQHHVGAYTASLKAMAAAIFDPVVVCDVEGEALSTTFTAIHSYLYDLTHVEEFSESTSVNMLPLWGAIFDPATVIYPDDATLTSLISEGGYIENMMVDLNPYGALTVSLEPQYVIIEPIILAYDYDDAEVVRPTLSARVSRIGFNVL